MIRLYKALRAGLTLREWWDTSRLGYRLSLPGFCKIMHAIPVEREHYNWDAHAVEEAWLECPRCGHTRRA